MTPAEIVARARSARGQGIGYELGCGGTDPKKPHPGARSKKWPKSVRLWCDCSGLVDWALGIVGRQHDKRWYNTDAIEADAKKPGGIFDRVTAEQVLPGDVVVYGAGPAIGHTGIVTANPYAAPFGTERWWKDLRVVHCSSGNWRRYRDAIRETTGLAFRRPDTVFARYTG